MTEDRNKKTTTFRLSPSVLEFLDTMAIDTGKSKTAIVEKALLDYYKRYDKDLEMDIREQVQEIHEFTEWLKKNLEVNMKLKS